MEHAEDNNIQHLTPSEITQSVLKIQEMLKTAEAMKLRRSMNYDALQRYISPHCTAFHQAYPALFRMVIEKGSQFEMAQLMGMLQLREKMRTGEVSERDANHTVGQTMVDKYVKPNLPP